MGLKHKAIHAMLANPHLAPFDLIERPRQRQDWTLIDHLMVIYKVKESDYVEDDPQASIVSMARTLACRYMWENAGTRCLVLVKDGAQAQKPAVREIRQNRAPVPHIDFCKRNLPAIEYTAMKLLADMGMKNKLFLVTGAKGASSEGGLVEGTAVIDNLVSFHQKYLDYLEAQDKSVFANALEDLKPLEFELSDIDSSYGDGSIDRPEGLEGVFVATFADPETQQVSILQDACLECTSTEADMLLIELANVLEGSVTVCTGDSDVVAVLTASGREGITLRMDNKSYREDREMHMSTFGDLLFASPENQAEEVPFSDSNSSEDRFRVLCDITEEDVHLIPIAQEQHVKFEDILGTRGKVDFEKNVALYLYLCGIRGSLYCTFLSRFFDSRDSQSTLDELGLAVDDGRISTKRVCDILETLYPVSEESPLSSSESDSLPCTGKKRKISCLQGNEATELYPGDGSEPKASKDPKWVMNGLKRLSNAYRNGTVPRGSYGRFLRLSRAGRHIFVRVKEDVLEEEKVRMEKLFFMALCGTDYNIVPMGLGIKRLMTGAVTNSESFSAWCRELKSLLWCAGTRDCDYYSVCMKLAVFTNVPAKTRAKYWTEASCGLMARTMKYVCELWNLERPKPGPDYGFSVRDGVVNFDCRDESLFVNAVNYM